MGASRARRLRVRKDIIGYAPLNAHTAAPFGCFPDAWKRKSPPHRRRPTRLWLETLRYFQRCFRHDVVRAFTMPTLHRYLLRQTLATCLLTVATFTLILLLGNVLKEQPDFVLASLDLDRLMK